MSDHTFELPQPQPQSSEVTLLKNDLMVDLDRTINSCLAMRDFYDRFAKNIIQLRDIVKEVR